MDIIPGYGPDLADVLPDDVPLLLLLRTHLPSGWHGRFAAVEQPTHYFVRISIGQHGWPFADCGSLEQQLRDAEAERTDRRDHIEIGELQSIVGNSARHAGEAEEG